MQQPAPIIYIYEYVHNVSADKSESLNDSGSAERRFLRVSTCYSTQSVRRCRRKNQQYELH